MKLFKYSLIALAMAFTFSACDDDNKYVEGAQSPGAFFPKNSPEVVELPQTGNSVDITIARTSLDDPSTYTLVCEDASGLFTFPSTVTFGPQEHTTTITVTYDGDDIITDELYPASITVEGASIYGKSTYSFDFCRKAPLIITETSGLFYSAMWNGTPWDIDVDWCVSETNKDLILVRLPNLFEEEASITIDLSETFPDGTHPAVLNGVYFTGTSNSEGYEIYWTSIMDFYLVNGFTEEQVIQRFPKAKYGCNFNAETGVISLYNTYSLPDKGPDYWFSEQEESIHLAGYPDYSVEVKYSGVFMAPNGNDVSVLIDVTSGPDVKEVRVANVATDNYEDVLEALKNESIDYQTVNGGEENVRLEFPITEGGIYTVVAVSVDKDGKTQLDSYQTYKVNLGIEDVNKGWTSLGTGELTDGVNGMLWMQNYNPAAFTYDVEIQEKDDAPGVYRVVDFFGNSPIAQNNEYDGIGYFVVDCSDPSYPLASVQFVGWEDEWGKLSIGNYEAFLVDNNPGATKAAVQGTLLQNGFQLSNMANGVITLPNPIWNFSVKYPTPHVGDYDVVIALPSAVKSSPKKVAGSSSYVGNKRQISAKNAQAFKVVSRFVR